MTAVLINEIKDLPKARLSVEEAAHAIAQFLLDKTCTVSDITLKEQLGLSPLFFNKAAEYGVKQKLFIQKGYRFERLLESGDTREARLRVLEGFKEGDRVFCPIQERLGEYRGIQDTSLPYAFVRFDDKGVIEPTNPLNLTRVESHQMDWEVGDRVVKLENGSLFCGTVVELEPDKSLVKFDFGKELNAANGSLKPIYECGKQLRSQAVEQAQRQGFKLGSMVLVNKNQGIIDSIEHGGIYNPPSPKVQIWVCFEGVQIPQRFSIQDIKLPSNNSASLTVSQAEKSIHREGLTLAEIPSDFEGDDLSKQETLDLIEQANNISALVPEIIKYSQNYIRYILLKIDRRNGWKSFDCSSMSNFLEKQSQLFNKAYSSLQKEWQAGKLEQAMRMNVGSLPESQCRELLALESPEQCLVALEVAKELGKGKVTAEHVRAAVDKLLKRKPQRKVKTKCGWVNGPNASRFFRVDLCGQQVQLHQDSHGEVAQSLERLSESLEKSPEQLLIEGLLGVVSAALSTSNVGAIAAAIEYLGKNNA
jgi:hypothetical protein